MKYHIAKVTAVVIAIVCLFLVLISTTNKQAPSIDSMKLSEDIGEQKNIAGETITATVQEEPAQETETNAGLQEEPPAQEEKQIVKTFISDEKCEDGIISLRLNNLYNDSINLKMSTFFVSGKINVNPGCDKDFLEPGESAFCDNVGSFPRKGRIRVAVAIYKHTTVGITVDCGSGNLVIGGVTGVDGDPYSFSPVFSVTMIFVLLFVFNYYRVHH